MKKIYLAAIAAGVFAVLSTQQSYAQYGQGIPVGSAGISDETLRKCQVLGIDRAQCTEPNVLLKERVGLVEGGGSGTGFIAEAGQMATVIAVLGTLFGGVAGAFFLMGRRKQLKTA